MKRRDLQKVITDLTEARAKHESKPSNAMNADIAKLCGASIDLMTSAGVALDPKLAPSEWDRYLRWRDDQHPLSMMEADKVMEFLEAAVEALRRVQVPPSSLMEDDEVALHELWAWQPTPLMRDR